MLLYICTVPIRAIPSQPRSLESEHSLHNPSLAHATTAGARSAHSASLTNEAESARDKNVEVLELHVDVATTVTTPLSFVGELPRAKKSS